MKKDSFNFAESFAGLLGRLRTARPLIHCLTNYVTAHEVANLLLAAGASPLMADEPLEAAEITSKSQGLYLNLGTLGERSMMAMRRSLMQAAQSGLPVVLDPVGVLASHLRLDFAREMLEAWPLAALRCNASEFLCLSGLSSHGQGVDGDSRDCLEPGGLAEKVLKFAGERNLVLAVTGEKDIVSDGKSLAIISNGHSFMGRVTGTGCQVSALLAAFLALKPERPFAAAALALGMYGLAGELAFKEGIGTASYGSAIIDEVSLMTSEKIEKGLRYEIIA